MSLAKKRGAEAISADPPTQTAEDLEEKKIKEQGEAVKKAKLAEVASDEPHKTKEMPMEEEGDAMDMDMGDDEDEQYVTKGDLEGMSPEEIAKLEEERKMMEEMGFPTSFGSTKGRHVDGNNTYVAHKIKQRKAAQHIHKKGRPKHTGRPPHSK